MPARLSGTSPASGPFVAANLPCARFEACRSANAERSYRAEDPNRFGPLMEDRPHVLKLFTSYALTERLSASGYFRVQSGTPWNARGRDWAGAALNYLEPAGAHRNPAWSNLDLMGSYRLPLSGRAAVSFEARLLNVFNTQTRLATDARQFLDLPTIPSPPYFGPYVEPNPFFGTGSAYAPPRRLFVAAVATF